MARIVFKIQQGFDVEFKDFETVITKIDVTFLKFRQAYSLSHCALTIFHRTSFFTF